MTTLENIASTINIGDNGIRDIKLTQSGLLLKNVKQICIVAGGKDFTNDFSGDFDAETPSLIRIFDRQTYVLDTGTEVQFTAAGGTIDASSQITSVIKHGDNTMTVIGYSGNPVITLGPNILPREKTGAVQIRQNSSNLMEMLYWRQAAAE